MKQYLERLQARPAHHRRRFSMQAAMVMIGIVFLGWVSTLGLRLSSNIEEHRAAAQDNANSGAHLVAAAAQAGQLVSEQVGALKATVVSVGQGSVSWQDTSAQGGNPASAVLPATVILLPGDAANSTDASLVSSDE